MTQTAANPSYSAASAGIDRSPAAIKLDNMIRQRLRVSDPQSAAAVAEGLRRVFPKDDEALKREASGLPLVLARPVSEIPAGDAPSSTELIQAVDDTERDLASLTADSQLKDIQAELEGWGQAIRSVIADGTAAARVALDPRARDRAFAARRQLADYARMARLVGAMTPNHNMAYRRFAQSLDEVGGLILVLVGEALARMGFSGGRFLLAAPASELQNRRDAVMAALRQLTASTDEAYAASQWPRGLHALRSLLGWLEQSGQADLRAYLDENMMARTLDELIDRASTGGARGYRALAATAPLALQQLNRLLRVVSRRVDPQSPTLSTFSNALRLFADGFRASAGQRLLAIARPSIVFYGLYGLGQQDQGTVRLQQLVAERGRLANLLDCYLACGCSDNEVRCQAVLDKLLADVDRAIDLYALGSDTNGDGEPEQRAAAYGLLIRLLVNPMLNPPAPPPPAAPLQPTLNTLRQCLVNQVALQGNLTNLSGILLAATPALPPALQPGDLRSQRMEEEICLQRDGERRWFDLVEAMAPPCVDAGDIHRHIDDLLAAGMWFTGSQTMTCPPLQDGLPPTPDTSLDGLVYLQPSQGRP